MTIEALSINLLYTWFDTEYYSIFFMVGTWWCTGMCLLCTGHNITLNTSFFKQKLCFNFCPIKGSAIIRPIRNIFILEAPCFQLTSPPLLSNSISQTMKHKRRDLGSYFLGSQVKWHSPASSPSEITYLQITWFLSNILHQNQDELAALFLRKATNNLSGSTPKHQNSSFSTQTHL